MKNAQTLHETQRSFTLSRSRIFKHMAVTDRLYEIIICPCNFVDLFSDAEFLCGIRLSVQRMASQFFCTNWLTDLALVSSMILIARSVSKNFCTCSSNAAFRIAFETHSRSGLSCEEFSRIFKSKLTRFLSMNLCVRPRTINFDRPSTSSINEKP